MPEGFSQEVRPVDALLPSTAAVPGFHPQNRPPPAAYIHSAVAELHPGKLSSQDPSNIIKELAESQQMSQTKDTTPGIPTPGIYLSATLASQTLTSTPDQDYVEATSTRRGMAVTTSSPSQHDTGSQQNPTPLTTAKSINTPSQALGSYNAVLGTTSIFKPSSTKTPPLSSTSLVIMDQTYIRSPPRTAVVRASVLVPTQGPATMDDTVLTSQPNIRASFAMKSGEITSDHSSVYSDTPSKADAQATDGLHTNSGYFVAKSSIAILYQNANTTLMPSDRNIPPLASAQSSLLSLKALSNKPNNFTASSASILPSTTVGSSVQYDLIAVSHVTRLIGDRVNPLYTMDQASSIESKSLLSNSKNNAIASASKPPSSSFTVSKPTVATVVIVHVNATTTLGGPTRSASGTTLSGISATPFDPTQAGSTGAQAFVIPSVRRCIGLVVGIWLLQVFVFA